MSQPNRDKDAAQRYINLAKHAIGLGRKRPYHRHGKAFFKPYRNYFAANKYGDDWCAWNEMCRMGLAKYEEDKTKQLKSRKEDVK